MNRKKLNLEDSPFERMFRMIIQPVVLRKCLLCGLHLKPNLFHRKRTQLDARCKDCVSKQKASRYKRKKVNKMSASKRITKLIDLRKANVFETQVSASTETSRLTELLQEIVIDIVTQTRQESGVEYGHQ